MIGNTCFQSLGERRSEQSNSVAVLVDSRGFPILPTDEALRVLLYPRECRPDKKGCRLAWQSIRTLFPAGPLSKETREEGEFTSGRRRYLYRIYRFGDSQANPCGPAAVIVLERYRTPLIPPAASLKPYGLSDREKQVLRLVLTGLSNKQIAEEMGISPNTVKAFLRLIMTKMEVSSRFAILGKLLGPPDLRRPAGRRPSGASAMDFRLA